MAEETDVDRARHEFENLAGAYQRAREFLTAERHHFAALTRVEELIGLYHGDPPERAVWILGQIKEALREIQEAKRVIRDYESRKTSLDRLKAAAG
jgi:hypothetical protein